MQQEKMCANHTTDKGLLLQYTRSSHNSMQSNNHPVFKRAKDLNRCVSKDDAQTTKQDMGRCSTSPSPQGSTHQSQ